MDKIIKIGILLIGVIVCISILVFIQPPQPVPYPGAAATCIRTTIYFFYSDTCPHCHNVMPFMKGLQENYTNIDVKYLEISNTTNNNMFVTMNKQRNIISYGVPEVIVGDTVLIGDIEIPEKLEALIQKC